MKAYELIWKLLRHPFADVRFSGVKIISHCFYNRYLKQHTLESLTDEIPNDTTREIQRDSRGNSRSL